MCSRKTIHPKNVKKLEKFFSITKTYEEYLVIYEAMHIMFGNCPVVGDEDFCKQYNSCFDCWRENYAELVVEET